ncbi:MAG TPA: TolC family protein, partial [Chitinophagaceae bacterium]|nr:TolC family protein [Chitinophagaceae bacterium]
MKYKLKNVALFFFPVMVFSCTSFAQEKKQLDLREAIKLSLKNSKQLKYSFTKIEEATAALKEAVQKRLPDASVSGSYLRVLSADFHLDSKNSSGNGSNTGGSPNVKEAIYGMLNASFPIYEGGKIKYGIESSKYLEKAARADAENSEDEVIQTTIEAFANLFKAKSAVSLMKENLQQSQQREKDFSNLEKNGLLARNDLLKAELQSSNVELNLLDAENNWQLANVNMDLMLGLSTTTEIVLDTTGIEKRNDSRTLDEFLQAALTNRKDMAALDYRKKAAIANVKSSEGELYPNLKLT